MVIAEIEDAIKDLMQMKQRPDAIFCAGDRLTISCLTALKELGIKIPADIGVVGFTNSELVELIDPSLTAVKQPAFEMGQIATELLIKLIEAKRPITEFETVTLQTELCVRNSTNNVNEKVKMKKLVM